MGLIHGVDEEEVGNQDDGDFLEVHFVNVYLCF